MDMALCGEGLYAIAGIVTVTDRPPSRQGRGGHLAVVGGSDRADDR